MTQRTFGHGSLLWCNVGITSAGAKAFHLHNNNNNNNDNKLLTRSFNINHFPLAIWRVSSSTALKRKIHHQTNN